MKKFTKLRIALTMALGLSSLASALAQVSSLPAPSPIGTIYKHGTNSTGPAAATEDPDRVTIGTKVLYLVVPDPDLNPNWLTNVTAGGDARTTTGISSTASWVWTVPGSISTTFNALTNIGHFVIVSVDGPASTANQVINVKEQNGSSCSDASGKAINVWLVDQPTASALSVPSATTCGTGTNGSLGVALPVFTLTKATDTDIPGDPSIIVQATLSFQALGSATSSDVFANKKLAVSSTGVISNADIITATGIPTYKLNSWGTYTLTITKISDKISRKDMDATQAGYFNVSSVSTAYTVLKPPTTGDIYHLPNN